MVGLQLPQEGGMLGTAAEGTDDLPGLQEHGVDGGRGSSRELALATLG